MLADLLACPVCHRPLEGDSCVGCRRRYAAVHPPDLTPVPPPDAEVLARWEIWERLQANGQQIYEDDPEGNLSVGERDDARAFAEFCALDGTVLDIGCGPQALPSYAAAREYELVGIDPLAGVQPRKFEFVKGIAEYLPFRDEAFDRVLFATSLDHVLSPRLAISEARRVVKPTGRVCVWHGEVPPAETAVPPPAPSLPARARVAGRMLARGQFGEIAARARRALGRTRRQSEMQGGEEPPAFEIPAGAVDAFHFAHPDVETVTEWLTGAGLRVERVERQDGNCFISALR
jgi:SAM-dependent methyltransferase